ncbi:glutamyl endopeptidase [Sorangium cellulosum So ce56]|uniref:Serine protease n=1 Tax=Sorangium cellulosum (strain So ce56) TaxID=448385 RepID=A9FWK4_SORC5|nr:glutamyl endopeptidase [Sorangium cellulosum So ce56]
MYWGHRSRRNEERGAALLGAVPRAAITGAVATPSHEPVPGYRRLTRADVARAKATMDAALAAVGRTRRLAADAAFGSKTLSGDFVQPSIFFPDDRRPILNPQLAPWRAICALRIHAADGSLWHGTGWFIGPRTVITAGHCIFMHNYGEWVTSVEVIPALDGDSRPFGSAVGTVFRTVEGWVADRDDSYDYGAILLGEDLGTHTGHFVVDALSDQDLESAMVNLAGYPIDRDMATRLYFHARQLQSVEIFRLLYDIDTESGQSGSPIWLVRNGQQIAVGLHTKGDASVNWGTRISVDVLGNLRRWLNESSQISPPTPAPAPVAVSPAETDTDHTEHAGRGAPCIKAP